jgi:molecular chaperone GrpE
MIKHKEQSKENSQEKENNNTEEKENNKIINNKNIEKTKVLSDENKTTIQTDYKKLCEQKENELKDLNSQLLRLRAEFDNYRKRVEKEKEMSFNFGKQSVLFKLINLIDIFDNALKQFVKTENLDINNVIEGIKLIHKEFISFILKEGICPIESIGKKFSPIYHEIVGYEYNDECEENTIIREIQTGYMCDEEVIRPAKVIVSKKNESKDIIQTSK